MINECCRIGGARVPCGEFQQCCLLDPQVATKQKLLKSRVLWLDEKTPVHLIGIDEFPTQEYLLGHYPIE